MADSAYGFSWKWAAPAIAIVLATLAVGVLRYPSLPEEIPIHLNAAGAVDAYASKSLLSVFGIVGVQVLLLPLLFVASSSRLRRLSSSRDFATYGREMLLFAAAVQLTLMLGALLVWQMIPPGWWVLPLLLLPTLGGVAYLLAQNLRQPAPGMSDSASAGSSASPGAGDSESASETPVGSPTSSGSAGPEGETSRSV